ncbi:MAG: Bax inhibitor-1/YccA family protein [Bdellovibrionales bacterium]
MANPLFRTSSVGDAQSASVDQGLRAHMQRIFNYMGGGLALTGVVAYLVANTPLAALVFGTPLQWLFILAPFAIIFYMSFKMENMPLGRMQTLYWTFCGLMGVSMATIFMVYTGASVARAFFITAATFGAMSLWGYTTKKDLTSFGAFLMMGVLGLFIASLVNIFMQSNMMQWVVSVAGVFIFTGLTAYDVQTLKHMYQMGWGKEANNKMAVMGAIRLYINFINAFQFLLSLTGERR